MLLHLHRVLRSWRRLAGSSAQFHASLGVESLGDGRISGCRPARPATLTHVALRCEHLEERILLATRIWTGRGGNPLASNAANWDVAPVAGESLSFQATNLADCVIDAAFINNVADLTVGAGYTGTVTSARDLTATGTVAVTDGTLNVVGSTLTAQQLDLTGSGLLNGAGDVNVQGSMMFSGTTIDSTRVTIAPGATLDIWANVTLDAAQLTNKGLTTLNTGNLTGLTGAIFNNEGTFTIACPPMPNPQYVATTFNNYGVVSKAVGGGPVLFAGSFNNQVLPPFTPSQVYVTAGEIDFTGSGASNGLFITGAAGTIGFTGGSHTLHQGADLSGAGTFVVRNASLIVGDVAATVNCSSLLILGIEFGNRGVLSGPGSFTLSGLFEWQGGLVTAGNVVGFGTIDGNLTLDGGTLDESMQFGPGTVFVTGNYIQTGAGSLILKAGDINGVPTNDVLAVTGSAQLGGRLTVIEMGPVKSGDTFQILVAGMGVTGTFLNPEGLPPLEWPLYWLPVGYNSTSVILTVGTLTPPNPVPGGA